MKDDALRIRCIMDISDTRISLAFQHAETVRYFGDYVQILPPQRNAGHSATIPAAEWTAWLQGGGTDDGYGEYTCSTACVSDALLEEGRCIIHAVAFRHGEKAWLIAGPSGSGKTTQVRNLQRIQRDEFQVICGDRPALRLTADGQVFVYPSPWNGKEDWKGAEGAPLAGVIFLERGESDSISGISAKEAVRPLLSALIHTGETEENIKNLAGFADAFLRRTMAYKMLSHEIPASTELLYNTVFLNQQCL